MIDALIGEMELRSDYLDGEPVQSIYFGGGTPSLLESVELAAILDKIYRLFDVSTGAEITMEANPDDLTGQKLSAFKASGINRLSIGIQTFDDERLKYINRAHNRKQAISSLEKSLAVGFENITADLIYAIPPDDLDYWEKDLRTMLAFELPHLSIYGLTIEPKTVFGQWAKRGELKEVNEGISARQYQLAMDLLAGHGYDHYEVSNFAKNGMYSRHNSAYWEDQTYLGIGPGAHSYDGHTRAFNVSNNAKYLEAIGQQHLPLTTEKLTPTDRANEYLFTHLRTKKGIDTTYFSTTYEKDILKDHEQLIGLFQERDLIRKTGSTLALTPAGFMLADEISLRLFYDG